MAGVKDTPLQPKGYEQIVNPAASTALTVPDGAKFALFNVSAGTAIRMRDDGTAPTATTGLRLILEDKYWYTGKLSAVRVIQQTSGTLEVLYYA